MTIDELTEAERLIILKYRMEEDNRKKRAAFCLHVLETAFYFEKWMQENGYANTFSTFTGGFGYEGEDTQQVYMSVNQVLKIFI